MAQRDNKGGLLWRAKIIQQQQQKIIFIIYY